MKRFTDKLLELLALLLVLLVPVGLALLAGTLDFQAATSGPNF